LEPVKVHKRFVESLLHDVLSVLSVAGYPESNGEGLCFMSLHEKFEGLTLPVLCRCD
jgi:hypothetical protein